jgi:hypothetical protein
MYLVLAFRLGGTIITPTHCGTGQSKPLRLNARQVKPLIFKQ